MKILFVGNMNEHMSAYSVYFALKTLGHELVPVSTYAVPDYSGVTNNRGFVEKVANKCGITLDVYSVNRRIIELLSYFEFDMLLSFKALVLRPHTLRIFKESNPSALTVYLSGDNMCVKNYRGGHWSRSYKLFDLHITMKKHNVDDLYRMGCREVIYMPKSFDQHWMLPVSGCKYLYDVIFIGNYEHERFEAIKYLAFSGVSVHVWGNGWTKISNIDNLVIHDRPVFKQDYCRLVSSSRITLCFLRKLAKDEDTNRTFEIPAMGGFMLAERTQSQLDFFKEAQEADYFSSKGELLSKVKYYLSHIDQLEEIARNGRKRCICSGYDYESRLTALFNTLEIA